MTYIHLLQNGRMISHVALTGACTIGRDPTTTLPIPDPAISRLHCVVEPSGDAWQLRDHSTNGTFLNGERVEKHAIDIGDTISVGTWTLLVTDQSPDVHHTVVSPRRATPITHFDATTHVLSRQHIRLTLKGPGKRPKVSTFHHTPIMIGTHPSCDLVVDAPAIAPIHCRIEREGDDYWLIDEGSEAGLYWMRERITRHCLPTHGAWLMGDLHVRCVIEELHQTITPDASSPSLVGTSRAMRHIIALIQSVADTDATVCITGETGTGKEMVARAIHDASSRAPHPFVAVNCGAIPANLIESELFGHEKGAFTGTATQHRGFFEQADGGTLFLDEIGEMPLELQTRLLRALENRRIRRIGGKEEIALNLRFIAATHRDIPEMVAQGTFREDLYYRLFLLPIAIPPLRERREDIAPLAHHFVTKHSASPRSLETSAIDKLRAHSWPGNVRELEHTIRRSLLLKPDGALSDPDILLNAHPSLTPATSLNLDEREKEAIIEALRATNSNRSHAAKRLGIARGTLIKKIKELGLKI